MKQNIKKNKMVCGRVGLNFVIDVGSQFAVDGLKVLRNQIQKKKIFV